MKTSWVRNIIILLVSILIASVLFFAVVSLAYSKVYQQVILNNNNNAASRWTSSIDTRLNTIYEHVYDLTVTLYRNTPINEGSLPADYQITQTLQDSMNNKMMASSDITCMFILDAESGMFLFVGNPTLSQVTATNLKLYTKSYCLEANSPLNARKWDLLNLLEHGYYYKAIKMGKYIIGAMSDCTYYIPDSMYSSGAENATTFIRGNEQVVLCKGENDLDYLIDPDRTDDYFYGEYAISTTEQQSALASTVYITKPQGFSTPWKLASLFLIVDSALCVLMVVMLIASLNNNVRRPVKELVKANQELAKGNLDFKLNPEQAGSDEFEELYSSFNDMSSKIDQLTIESYDLKLKREENRLKMLRAQMKPHTFLNGITTISNMTYTSKPEEIREYIASFARFTRYMLNKSNDWTTVREELQNIDSYVKMQKIRFPNSIEISYECDEDIMDEKVPYLVLFSLVENSFKHAMTLVNTMYIRISGSYYEEEGFKGIKLIEEDNGSGFSENALEKLAEPERDDLFTKEHLGLTNVRYSLNMIYNRDDLLRLSNKEEGGARIELLIPSQEKENETAGM